MAEHRSIEQYLKENRSTEAFKPYAYYSPQSDSLTFYFSDEPDYAERLHSRVTVFFSMKSKKLVGCRIKSVRRVLDDIGMFPVNIKHGGTQIAMLFLAFRADAFESEDARKIWRELMEQSSKVEIPITEKDDSKCSITG